MSEEEILLRLIGMASTLPAVRAGVDHQAQAARAFEVAQTWYNGFIGVPVSQKQAPAKRDNRKAPRS